MLHEMEWYSILFCETFVEILCKMFGPMLLNILAISRLVVFVVTTPQGYCRWVCSLFFWWFILFHKFDAYSGLETLILIRKEPTEHFDRLGGNDGYNNLALDMNAMVIILNLLSQIVKSECQNYAYTRISGRQAAPYSSCSLHSHQCGGVCQVEVRRVSFDICLSHTHTARAFQIRFCSNSEHL